MDGPKPLKGVVTGMNGHLEIFGHSPKRTNQASSSGTCLTLKIEVLEVCGTTFAARMESTITKDRRTQICIAQQLRTRGLRSIQASPVSHKLCATTSKNTKTMPSNYHIRGRPGPEAGVRDQTLGNSR